MTMALLAGSAVVLTRLAAASEPVVQLTPAQSRYMEGCGGCHGIQGISSKEHVPDLLNSVGRFLCTPAGREYIVRLPNVAFADADDRLLADVMNFIVFGFGGASTPVGAPPYTASEVGALRRQPLKNRQLVIMRAAILADADNKCDARMRAAR